MNIKITHSTKRKAISAIFNIGDNWFYVDVANLPYIGNECEIFKADKEGNVTDWTELYCNRDVEVSEAFLLRCIREFCEENGYDSE